MVALLSASSFASVSISSPSAGSTTGSPVHFVATASSSHPITHFNIYVDGAKVYKVDASKLSAYVSLSSGSHKAQIKAWDSSGASQAAWVSFSVGTSTTTSSSTTTTVSSSATTFDQIEEKSGWHGCSACANAGGGSPTDMVQGLSSPSLDGNSTSFLLGGTVPWSHALYHKTLSGNGSATHFVYDVRFYIKHPKASSGMEFSVSQRRGYKWFRWDTQCSYESGIWKLWDNGNVHWVKTGIPCKRPGAYTWTHIVMEGQRVNGKVLFVSITVNGQKYYINKSYYPAQMSTSNNAVKIHFQLNGNAYQTDYKVWGDRFKVSYW